jgi:hypothetical protein
VNTDRRLAAVSTVQLLSGLAGLRTAIQRRLPSNPLFVNIQFPTSHIARDSFFLGTARSAPDVMLLTQAAATASLVMSPGPRARRTLGVLGAIMIFGYLVERESPLWPGRGGRLDTPLYAVGLAGAIAMARLGLRHSDDPGDAAARSSLGSQ